MEIIKNDSGMTMIELLIAFVIFGILVVAVTPVFKEGSDSWQDTKAEVELRQNLNSALQLMSRELRQAKASSINIEEDENEIVNYQYSTDGSTNYFKVEESSEGTHYIEFNSESVTAPALINITEACVVRLSSNPPKFEIAISGEYVGSNEIASRNRKLTVKTTVVVRSSSNLEEWQEDI